MDYWIVLIIKRLTGNDAEVIVHIFIYLVFEGLADQFRVLLHAEVGNNTFTRLYYVDFFCE